MSDSGRRAGAPAHETSRQASAGRFWIIEPAASMEDSRWQDRSIWRVVVAASTANFARQAAEAWALPSIVPQIGNESDSPLAGFLDEKLYHVRAVPGEVSGDPAWQQRADGAETAVLDAELLREAPDIIET